MSIPKPTISPLVVTDLPILAQFLFTSQLSQPTNQFLFSNWPNEAAQIALYTTGMEKSFADPLVEMYKATDTTSGEIVATLILTRSKPPAAPVAAPIAETAAVSNAGTTPPTGVIPAFHAVLKRMLADVQKRMDGVDHFVLSSIFVKPLSRHEGLGSRLVQLCVDKARIAGLPLFLASVPSALGFYQKLGFVETGHAEVDLSTWGPKYGGFGVYRLSGMLKND
ncbi:hypothetical protein MMC15_002155 [Xylographa vitiligo]|nr:hypothetical protein [Xylographa vitiligo]